MQLDAKTRAYIEAYINNRLIENLTYKIQESIESKVRKLIFSKDFISELKILIEYQICKNVKMTNPKMPISENRTHRDMDQ